MLCRFKIISSTRKCTNNDIFQEETSQYGFAMQHGPGNITTILLPRTSNEAMHDRVKYKATCALLTIQKERTHDLPLKLKQFSVYKV